MNAQKPREIAAQTLINRERSAAYIETLLETELQRAVLSPQDRGLLQELTYGVVRWQSTLDWLIERKTAGREQKPALRVLLRLGLYQMFWLDRIPNHASVNETVEIAKRLGFGPQAGFVNAILRGYSREMVETANMLEDLKRTDADLGYSHPEWLCREWFERWGEEKLGRLLDWNNSPPPTFARLNTLKGSAADLAAHWQRERVDFLPRSWDWTGPDLVFELLGHPSLSGMPSFQKGLFYVQDPSTLLSVRELNPKPWETVLDLCAAPGGKTTYMAQIMKNQGVVVAHDSDSKRLELVKQNSARLGTTCVKPSPALDQTGIDAYDRILVDAPCSNTGVMRRRVDLRWLLRPEDISKSAETQLGLLRAADGRLKPGGILVYSTCSLEPAENGMVVKEFLARNPGYRLESERQLLPFADGVDGAYVARLKKGK